MLLLAASEVQHRAQGERNTKMGFPLKRQNVVKSKYSGAIARVGCCRVMVSDESEADGSHDTGKMISFRLVKAVLVITHCSCTATSPVAGHVTVSGQEEVTFQERCVYGVD